MITICCLKQGKKYNATYVNRLYNMVSRNMSEPFKFVCFTDNRLGINKEVDMFPLPYNAEGWWGKMGLYKQKIDGVDTEKLLFLDLDVVITGRLEPICNYSSDFALAKDYPVYSYNENDVRQKWGNSSVVLLRIGSQVKIWDTFVERGYPQPKRCGDQEFINQVFYGECDLLPEDLVKSYKLHNLAGNEVPDCSVVMFHGTPKPPECGGWVKRLWR